MRGEVPVARRAEFVGRRRQAQAALRAFRDGAAGVLIHGMASLGKSSLAARIASRMGARKPVVVFNKYDELTVFDRLVEALPAPQRAAVRATWRDAVLTEPATLSEALETLLEGPLDVQPILLIVDDLEQILATPQPSSSAPTPVQPRYRAVLGALLSAFGKAQTESRLLITSRYRFTLPDGRGGDLADRLTPIPLQPMAERDRLKQLRAAERLADQAEIDPTLAARALTAAGGNPGLQATLLRPILRGETEAAAQALDAIEHYQRTGAPPAAIRRLMAEGAAQDVANAIVAFFKRMAFDTYRAALTESQAGMLRAAGVFSAGMPIPRPVLEQTGAAAGIADPRGALERLLGLGLADDWGVLDDLPYAAANPLARPLAGELDDQTRTQLAAAALPGLGAAWRRPDGAFAWDWRAVEITRLALIAPAPDPVLLDRAAEAAGRCLWTEHEARRAQETVLKPTLARLETLGAAPSHGLLLIACNCAERLGDTEAWEHALAMLEQSAAQGADRAVVWLYLGRRHRQRGDLPAAEQAFAAAARLFGEAGWEREQVIALGESADILEARGDLDEALRIRREEQLPVYERLGDVRERAVTLGKIADILHARGDLDAALWIRREEQLPVYERLGDVRERAVMMGRIADILQDRGDLDAALRINREEELPIYERLGDVRERAVTMGKIADILQARGDLDAALALHEQRLPIAQQMKDIDSIAHIKCSTAQIRLQRGDHQTGGLQQIYEDLDEAFTISLKRGRPDFIGWVGQLLAQVLAMGGQQDEALKVLDHAEAAFDKMGNAQGLEHVRQLREMIRSA